MATRLRAIELQPDAYDLVVREADRRGVEPDALVDELVRTDLGRQANGDVDAALDALAEFRAGLPRSTRLRSYAILAHPRSVGMG
jgi:hypothetical protein